LEKGKFTDDYLSSVAICEVNPEDLKLVRVKSGSNVKVKTAYGEVVVKVKESQAVSPGTIFIPMGPWANVLVDPNTYGSGMPTLKGVPATLEPTDEAVPTIAQLIQKFSSRAFEVKLGQKTVDPPPLEGVIKDVVCAFCGCVCDDIEVTIKGGVIESVKGACGLGLAKLLNYSRERVYSPMVRRSQSFVEVSFEEAVEEAADILVNAKYPLLYGWSSTSNEAVRLGVELAELVGGVIDDTSVTCHGPTTLALQETGVVTATLGQLKNRADLMVYWGCNPGHAHPRHTVRYSAMAKGRFVKGRRERRIVVVDVRETPTAKMADLFVKVQQGMDYELLTALRMAVKGYTIEVEEVAGVPRNMIFKLADMLTSAKFGVIFFGMGVTMTAGKGRNVEEAIRLVQELNDHTKFTILAMRGHYNVTGSGAVMTWLTGYPYAVDFSRGYPRYNPGVTSSTDILMRGDADAALIVASDPVSHFPMKAVENLSRIPVVVIDPRWSPTAAIANVFIPSAFVGIEVEGTVYRMDKVPIRAKKLLEPPPGVKSDVEILQALIDRVKARKLKGGG